MERESSKEYSVVFLVHGRRKVEVTKFGVENLIFVVFCSERGRRIA